MELPLVGLHPWLAQYGWVVLVHQWSWVLGLVINLIVLYVCHDKARTQMDSQCHYQRDDLGDNHDVTTCQWCRTCRQMSRRWSVVGLLVLATSVLYPIGGLYLLTGPVVVAAGAVVIMVLAGLYLAVWVGWEILKMMAESLQETFSWAFQKPER